MPALRLELAACKDKPVSLFYSNNSSRAIKVCHRCPVRQACLDDAAERETKLWDYEIYGVRGGMTPAQRRKYYRLLRELGRVS